MQSTVYDSRICSLGEGPLWHPQRKQLFWFDINNKRLLSRGPEGPHLWQFDECVSAAGWVSHTHLLIASESRLFLFDVETGEKNHLCALEADTPATRSNDGRADPWGGFWIGTMGKSVEKNAGAIYRYYQGALTQLYSGLSIPNSICFSPDKQYAYYTDTPSRQIMRQKLDAAGWPLGAGEVFIDLRAGGFNPDGSVVDAAGYLWNAQWGAARVARYTPDGRFDRALPFGPTQTSCPAFGGAQYKTLFVTSAAENMPPAKGTQGQTCFQTVEMAGQAEHRVKL